MTTKRIKDLSVEATSSTLTDNDYAVVDSGDNGTRKTKLSALAAWIHNKWAAFLNACTAITSFASGDTFSVSNPTDGTRKMSKDTLLMLTSQNALAGNVATEFVPNETNAIAGLPYVYGGKLYMAKEAYQGLWDASKFIRSSLKNFLEIIATTNVRPFVSRANTNPYVQGNSFVYAYSIYFVLEEFYGDFDDTKVVKINMDQLEFFRRFYSYFRRANLKSDGTLTTFTSLYTFYKVPIKAGSHVKIHNTWTTTAGIYATFVRYDSAGAVVAYDQSAEIDYVTTDNEYLSFCFQRQNEFVDFLVPSVPYEDELIALSEGNLVAAEEYFKSDYWKIGDSAIDPDGNYKLGLSDSKWTCYWKIPVPAGARIKIYKPASMSSSWRDFAVYGSDGSLIQTYNGENLDYSFDTEGFISYSCYKTSGLVLNISCNKTMVDYIRRNPLPKTALKSLSIIGASSSTYDGFIPSGQASYFGPYSQVGQVDFPNGVHDTWWHLVCSEMGIPLYLNDSWSGSRLTTSGGIGTPCLTRLENVYGAGTVGKVRPDVLVFYVAINDSWQDVPVGEPKYSDWTDADKQEIAPALCYCFDLIQKYAPGVKIVNIQNPTLKAEVKSAMATICEHYGVTNVVIPEGLNMSSSHPTQRGMRQIANIVERFMRFV